MNHPGWPAGWMWIPSFFIILIRKALSRLPSTNRELARDSTALGSKSMAGLSAAMRPGTLYERQCTTNTPAYIRLACGALMLRPRILSIPPPAPPGFPAGRRSIRIKELGS